MSLLLIRSLKFAAAVAVVSNVASLSAQERRVVQERVQERAQEQPGTAVRQARPNEVQGAATTAVAVQSSDQPIARWIAVDERAILECAQTARKRAQDDDVKAFAEKVVASHEKLLDELAAFGVSREDVAAAQPQNQNQDQNRPQPDGPQANLQRPAVQQPQAQPGAAVEVGRPGVAVQVDPRTRAIPTASSAPDFVAVKEQICRELREQAKDKWKSIEDSEFDARFLQHQKLSHEALLTSLKALRQNAGPQLQAAIDRSAEQVSSHLEKAKDLCKSLKKDSDKKDSDKKDS